jgi:transketolase
MEAVMNGLAAYGTIIPFGGTFFNFVSYASGAVRLAALSKFRVITVATHDSIGLGEDGPTHQPIETIAHFRATPNLMVWRPADGNETSGAYYVAVSSKETPSILCLSRQNLPQLEGSTIEHAIKGGYALINVDSPHITLASSGSEVSICVDAASELKKEGINARVVSLPCWETFSEQPLDYKLSVLPDGHPILYVEPFATLGTERMAHESFGVDTWGTSIFTS